nr:type III-B CRISPR module-associated Cmr3 family protein [uncultured Undibacterium sp.]
MNRTAYFIRPHSPLVFRSGRPFGEIDAGGADVGYNFPLPTTIAGALRAAWVDANNHHVTSRDQTLLALHVHGGLRAVRRQGSNGRADITMFAAKPMDAVYEGVVGNAYDLLAVQTTTLFDGEGCVLPNKLLPLSSGTSAKPIAGPEAWSLDALANWMQGTLGSLSTNQGLATMPHDKRTHVVIDETSQTNIKGGLYQSDGIDFDRPGEDQGIVAWLGVHPGSKAASPNPVFSARMARLGAEGRTATFEEIVSDKCAVHSTNCPASLSHKLDALKVGDQFRLLLLTPACYLRNGWYPDGLQPKDKNDSDSAIEGCLVPLKSGDKDKDWTFRLRAAALDRWLPIASSSTRNDEGSNKFTRRPLRRAVPSGTVYWLEIVRCGETPLSQLWMQSTCRTDFARDGFGLAIPGLTLCVERK